MNETQAGTKKAIEARINEAEVCRSMGLYDEALTVYEKLLTGIPEDDTKLRDDIRETIRKLKEEMAAKEGSDTEAVSADDISMFKKALTDQENNVQGILDSASAFRDLGLHEEAINEYRKLLGKDDIAEEFIQDYTDSLLKIHSPGEAVKTIEKTLKEDGLDKKAGARILMLAGREMEKRDHREPALNLYKSAKKMDPADTEIKKRMDSVKTGTGPSSRYDHLLQKEMVTTDQLQKAFALAKKMNKSVEFVLIEHFQVHKDDIAKSFSGFYNCKFRNYDSQLPIPVELLSNLKKTFLMNELWVPISWGKEGVEILVDDPRNLSKTDNIKALMKTSKIIFSVAMREDIESYIKRFFDEDQIAEAEAMDEGLEDFDLIPDVSFEEEDDGEEDDFEDSDESSSKVVKLVDQFIIAAYRKNASDIHVEPSPVSKATTIRFRMDGVCQDYLKVPNSMSRGVLSRIKIMANLDIAERRLPQDGKIKFKRKGIPPFELRVATLPTTGGYEDAVLRILAKAGAMKLDDMGLTERNFSVMEKILAKPYGLVLVVGPTGSGKTTTLHSALGYINKPGIKIWTAEDPVEITQAGLRQVEAKPKIGLTFARIMRAFLRADPDVIMIGEMRDEETASIGVEASLTGHLVFSTLHTNSAPETVTRLLDMGLNALNFSDAFLGVLAQRLVRRLCQKCRQEYHPTKDEFDEIVADYGSEYFERTGIEYSKDLMLYKPGSCEACSGTGYKGRIGIHELMDGSAEVKRMIKKQATSEDLFVQAMKEGMSTLKQDGIMKAFQGITDVSEVRRVCIN